MNGVLVTYKEKGCTSRDVVNRVGKILNTKKIGHIGTLDPMATGVMVLCLGSSLKLVEMMVNHDKEYIARIRLGIETDTLDITGCVVKSAKVLGINDKKIKAVLKKYKGKIKQEVPIYSSVKVHGKKLYEYARNGESVDLPVRDIEIYDIQLIDSFNNNEFSIKCHVSKGTYIRSLVRDIGNSLGTFATMTELERVKLGKFSLDDAFSISDIVAGNYSLLSPLQVLDLPQIVVDSTLEKKIKNGQVLPKFFSDEMVFILNKERNLLAIYQQKDDKFVKPYRMF